jgi:hypothetical protein
VVFSNEISSNFTLMRLRNVLSDHITIISINFILMLQFVLTALLVEGVSVRVGARV